ncbi:MAG: hypothetical protein ACO2ZP_07335 [Bacteriovoracaceae bacterium]
METKTIITLATEVAGVISKILDRLPSHEQKKMDAFFHFMDAYESELKMANADFDRIILMRQRKDLLIDTIIKQLKEKS